MELPLLLLMVVGGMWFVSVFGRKQQKRMAEEQTRRIEEALVPGNWVRTTSGFYGTVVEVHDEVVVLATPMGDETLWDKRAISGAQEPALAVLGEQDEASDDGQAQEGEASLDAEEADKA